VATLTFSHSPTLPTFTWLKKGCIILLLAIYAFSISGLSMQVHYCWGKVSGISLQYNSTQTQTGCKLCHQKARPACCTNELIGIDTDDTQGIPVFASIPPAASLYLQQGVAACFTAPPLTSSLQVPIPACSAPPTLPVPIYLYNMVFRN
jgi:hypothetical protein